MKMNEIRRFEKDTPEWSGKNVPSDRLTAAAPCDPPAVASWAKMGQYLGSDFQYTEPVQGCCKNCYLIAALASVAWAAQDTLSRSPTTFEFMNPENNSVSIVNLISENLPLDANNQLIFARSTSGFTWPMLYEKAYACWNGCDPIEGNPDHPDISQLPEGAGMRGLISVTRYRNQQLFYTDQQTPNQIIASIPQKRPFGKAMYPMVARADDHTYSLLGIYGVNIVLRNPYIKDPEPSYALTSGIWNVGNINFANKTDGIFAISANDFKQNFKNYGYVRP